MTALGPPNPLHWDHASKTERLLKSVMRCQVQDGDVVRSFVRGRLTLPVNDDVVPDFVWLVWVSVTQETWDTLEKRWKDSDRAKLPPFFGRMAVDLPYDESTFGLPMTCRMAEPNAGADFWVAREVEHPLAAEMEMGITPDRAKALERLGRTLKYTG